MAPPIPILVQGGTVVTASGSFAADVLVEGERIAAVGLGLARPGCTIVDARGRLVMPGGVDVHTHLDMPMMGTRSSDDFESGTIAAVFGGTTCIIDFVTPERGKPIAPALEAQLAKAEGKAVVDYGFHVCIVEVGPRTLDEMDELVRQGISSFKIFTAYPALMLNDGAIYRVMRWAAQNGALVQAHCENGPALSCIVEEFAARGQLEPRDHAASRPSRLEGEATARILALAEVAGATVYIVHLTCREALEAVRDARRRGVRAFAETCPQYLYLSSEDLARPGFEGAKYVCSPPLRPREHALELWRGLAAGDLQTVATDHCPFNFAGQKEMGRGDFRKIPNGLPGLETRVPLLHQGVVDGKISMSRFVDAVSTAPARLFGLYPHKGAVIPGADADLVLWDPEKATDLSASHLHMRVDHSIYEGKIVRGGPDRVFVRGQLIVDGERFLGKPGDGRFLAREVNS